MENNILITTSSFGKADSRPILMLKNAGFNPVLNPFGRKLTTDEAIVLIDRHQPLGIIAGVEPLTCKALSKATRLRVVSRCGIGMDSIDLAAAEKLGIPVTNTPDAPTAAVAELTLGLMLTLLRRIHVSDASIRSGGWDRPQGKLLNGKTVGIVGCGRIGRYLADLLAPFQSNILGYDKLRESTEGIQFTALEKLLKNSDIVTLHIPYNDETRHLIDRNRLSLMKRDALLVNASRGGLIDEVALLDALQNESIAGAALDCFETEPYTGKLRNFKNVLMTAHIGSYAREARVQMEIQATKNLLQLLA